jgi:hypothetical protein
MYCRAGHEYCGLGSGLGLICRVSGLSLASVLVGKYVIKLGKGLGSRLSGLAQNPGPALLGPGPSQPHAIADFAYQSLFRRKKLGNYVNSLGRKSLYDT